MADGLVQYTLRLRDEASAKLQGLTSEAKSAEAALDKVDNRSKSTSRSVGRLRDDAGETGSAMGKLGAALSAVDPKLAELAISANDAADGLEGVLQLAKVSPVGLAAVGAAALALGGAYLKLKSDLDKAEEAQNKMAEAAKRAQRVFLPLSDQLRSIEAEYRVVTGEITAQDLAFERQSETLRSGLIQALGEGGRAVLALEEKVRKLGEQQAGGADVADELIKSSTELGQARARLSNIERGQLQRYQDALPKLREIITAQKDLAAATGEATSAAEEQAAGYAQSDARATAFTGALRGQRPDAASFGFTPEGLEDAYKKAFRAAAESVEVRVEPLQITDAFQTMADRLGGVAASGLGAAGQALSNPLGLLSAAGPAGAGIGAALSLLEQVGREGSDAVVDKLSEIGTNIAAGLSELPELLAGLLMDLPLAIGEAVGDALRDLFSGRGLGEKIKDSPVRSFLAYTTLGASEAAIGAYQGVTGQRVGSFAVGDSRFINRTGLAMLHEGETVVRSSGQASGTAMARMGGGGGTNIQINGWVSPTVVDDLEASVSGSYSPYGYGRGRSPQFGR